MIKGDVIADISKELKNYNELMDGLKNGYYFPCAFMSWGVNLQMSELVRIGMGDLEVVTDQLVFKEIYLKWLVSRKPKLNPVHWRYLTDICHYEIREYIDFDTVFEYAFGEIKTETDLVDRLRRLNNELFMIVSE